MWEVINQQPKISRGSGSFKRQVQSWINKVSRNDKISVEIVGCHPPATIGLSYNELAVKTVLTVAAILDLRGGEKETHTERHGN